MTKTELYVPRKHVVKPICGLGFGGTGNNDRCDVKAYSMVPEGMADIHINQASAISSRLGEEVLDGHIKRNLGLGFLVISDGIANLALWGGKFPSLLNQSVYSFDPKVKDRFGRPELKRESLDESGTFCCYEGAIVGHESLAWRRFLFSPQAQADKITYLEDRFMGVVGPH
ncbi:MAG: hypothetical protein AABX53_03855 [Nanoarchaeota archaeon]